MDVPVPEINKLNELVRDVVGSDKKVKDVEVSRLTSPGENYGSCILKVDITLQRTSDGCTEVLHAVAKLIPEHELFRQIFQIQTTVKSEIVFYNVIIPTLQDFQRDHGITNVISCFPKLYAARLNLKEDSDVVDEDAVLLFENLNTQGFKNINRFEGFDLEGAKLVLKDLASLHAVPLALRLQKPIVFAEKLKKYLHVHAPPPPPPAEDNKPKPTDTFLEICRDFEVCAPYMPEVEKIITHFKEHPEFMWKRTPPSETWATLAHGDMWMYRYETPVKDLLFFLWTSCRVDILQKHFEDLLKHYHANFVKILEELGCNTTPYRSEKFISEVEQSAARTIFQALFFSMFVVQAKKKDVSEIGKPPSMVILKEDVNPLLKQKIAYAISYYGKKNLLKIDFQ
nr:unnamed protein product [Callosobruchus analis]